MFDDLVDFNLPFNANPIISVIGVGGGGCNAVNRMYLEGIKDVDFMVANTDSQALNASPVEKKIQLGATLTEGRGAGKRSDVGEQAAIESINEITDILQGQTRMVFIVAGMGKGTGTGAAPVIARACRDLNILTVGVITLPFIIEGPSRQFQALQGINRLKDDVDALLIIHNEKLREIYGNLSLGEAFKKADDILLLAVKGIAEIITVHGYINVDFADVISVMTKGGIAFMGSATARGFDRARKVIDETINSPLLYSNDIRGASRILLNITSGQDEITVDEVGIITDAIMARVGVSVNVIWGTCSDDSLTDEIRITLVATGFREDMIPEWLSLTPPKKEVINLDKFRPVMLAPMIEKVEHPLREEMISEVIIPETPEILSPVMDQDLKVVHREPTKDSIHYDHPAPVAPAEDPAKVARLKELNYHNLSNPDIIDEVERIPAYKRKKVPIQEKMFFEDDQQSRYTMGTDAKLRSNNSFLFDAVD
ncbi:MAG: cell division protein FtsZ [Porphyromonadaceae bacterium]|nr:MAG: cell division protein FtsZ [Porphyromonadaceae bacterium]